MKGIPRLTTLGVMLKSLTPRSYATLMRSVSHGEMPYPPWEAAGMAAFRIWFSRHSGDGVTVGLEDLRGLFQP